MVTPNSFDHDHHPMKKYKYDKISHRITGETRDTKVSPRDWRDVCHSQNMARLRPYETMLFAERWGAFAVRLPCHAMKR